MRKIELVAFVLSFTFPVAYFLFIVVGEVVAVSRMGCFLVILGASVMTVILSVCATILRKRVTLLNIYSFSIGLFTLYTLVECLYYELVH